MPLFQNAPVTQSINIDLNQIQTSVHKGAYPVLEYTISWQVVKMNGSDVVLPVINVEYDTN